MKYNEPEMELIYLEKYDVITMSNQDGGDSDPNDGSWI
jgi:hypothetical protein